MGVFWSGLSWFIGSTLGSVIFRGMWTLGIGYVTYNGLRQILDPVLQQLEANPSTLSGFGPYAAYAVESLRLVPSIAVIVAAITFALAARVLTSVGRRAVPKGN